MIKIILVDDHQMFMDGIKFLLSTNKEITVVGDSTTGEGAFKLLAQNEVDVVVLDVHIPNMDGEAILKQIKEGYPKVKVLVVSMSKTSQDLQRMLFNGADGYILKEKGGEQLVGAIHQVLAGQRYIPLELVDDIIPTKVSKVMQEFTKRELEILRYVAKGLKDKEIAAQLNIAKVTVETHCRSLRKKSGTKNKVQLINFARNNGLLN